MGSLLLFLALFLVSVCDTMGELASAPRAIALIYEYLNFDPATDYVSVDKLVQQFIRLGAPIKFTPQESKNPLKPRKRKLCHLMFQLRGTLTFTEPLRRPAKILAIRNHKEVRDCNNYRDPRIQVKLELDFTDNAMMRSVICTLGRVGARQVIPRGKSHDEPVSVYPWVSIPLRSMTSGDYEVCKSKDTGQITHVLSQIYDSKQEIVEPTNGEVVRDFRETTKRLVEVGRVLTGVVFVCNTINSRGLCLILHKFRMV